MRGAVEVYREGSEGYWSPIADRRIVEMEVELAAIKR